MGRFKDASQIMFESLGYLGPVVVNIEQLKNSVSRLEQSLNSQRNAIEKERTIFWTEERLKKTVKEYTDLINFPYKKIRDDLASIVSRFPETLGEVTKFEVHEAKRRLDLINDALAGDPVQLKNRIDSLKKDLASVKSPVEYNLEIQTGIESVLKSLGVKFPIPPKEEFPYDKLSELKDAVLFYLKQGHYLTSNNSKHLAKKINEDIITLIEYAQNSLIGGKEACETRLNEKLVKLERLDIRRTAHGNSRDALIYLKQVSNEILRSQNLDKTGIIGLYDKFYLGGEIVPYVVHTARKILENHYTSKRT